MQPGFAALSDELDRLAVVAVADVAGELSGIGLAADEVAIADTLNATEDDPFDALHISTGWRHGATVMGMANSFSTDPSRALKS